MSDHTHQPIPTGTINQPIQLDDLLTVEQAAEWFGLSIRTMRSKIAARIIPAINISRNILRIHPRTVLAKLAADGGMNRELVSAIFTSHQPTPRD